MINHALLHEAEQEISRTYTALNTVIIIKNGEYVYSNVFNSDCALDKPQLVYSVTKSITALLIGIAIDKGYIATVNQTLLELLPVAYSEVKLAAGVDEITLHQALSMTTGQLWANGALGNEPMLERVMKKPDWVAALLQFPVKPAAVGQFQYNTGLSHLLSAIISNTTGDCAEVFAEKHLFAPLGIDNCVWPSDPQGFNTGGWGLHLAPQDMAIFGQLVLNDGIHQNRQLVSSQWVQALSTAHTQEYGYQMWLRSSKGLRCWCAQGLGGQYICVIPEIDAVIVTTSQYAGRRQNLWTLFDQYWLPAIGDRSRQ